MKNWSFKVKVGVYSALLTTAALVVGGIVMMVTMYFYQIAEIDDAHAKDASELVWDLKNFRDAPSDPRMPLREEFIPVTLRDHFLMVEGPGGQIVYRSANLHGARLEGEIGKSRTVKLRGKTCRLGSWKVGDYVVRIGAKVDVMQKFMKDLVIGFAAALPAMGLVVFFGGMWLARRTVAPLTALSASAERISANNPNERLPIPAANDEIAKLTEVLNQSFDRLQASYEVATRFSADASHQLKTPVAILRAGVDHLSRATDLNEAQMAEVATIRQQTRRLTSLIEDLLLLAQADAGRMFLEREPINLKLKIQAAIDDLQTLVAEKDITVEADLAESMPVRADRRLLAMILQNLVENAAKYTPEGGVIRITGSLRPGLAVMKIANTGPGISPDDQPHVFERFRRGSSIGAAVRGHGLGLNIARELARAHGGDLVLNRSNNEWTEFELSLPSDRGEAA